MNYYLTEDWEDLLKGEFEQLYFKNLTRFVNEEYKNHQCYPPKDQIFSAFNLCAFNNLKVVIIGQDPYHGKGQANGLCFSVNDGVAHPPSLKNIFKELNTDLNIPIPKSGNLEHWAKQGVFLLNATLTVRAQQAGSHQNRGWEQLTDYVISLISEQKEHVVFLLWGGFAKKKISRINTQKHLVLTSGHPSPLSANRGHWFGNKHFSKTNNYLKNNGLKEMKW